MTTYTSATAFSASYTTLFKTFAQGTTKDLAWRKWQLKQCWWMVVDNEDRLLQALKADLNRHPFESLMYDINGSKADILQHIEHLEEWTADVRPDAGFLFKTLGKGRLRKQPLGVTLIIGAWNFPVVLVLAPMVAAIAAGCCIMIKPSELASHTQNLLEELIPAYLDPQAIRVVTGGPQEMSHILDHKFDHIFFTGSSKVARFVTAAAAKHLTPMVLELGGQGPTIVCKSANIELTAKCIATSKWTNAGQICLAVNHVFAEPTVYNELIERIGYWSKQFLKSAEDDMTHIVNERNFDRLSTLLDKTKGKIASGGVRDRGQKYFQPTVVRDVTMDDALMSEELFGPIVPVIKADVATALTTINSMPHALALYIFSNDQAETDRIINNTLSGGVTINNTMFHAGMPNAPFGGVGESGYGSYHGKYGLDSFSHLRAIVSPPTWLDRLMGFTYPPLDMKNRSKVDVKNKLRFKRGEKMEDQRIGARKISSRLLLNGSVAIVAVAALLWQTR